MSYLLGLCLLVGVFAAVWRAKKFFYSGLGPVNRSKTDEASESIESLGSSSNVSNARQLSPLEEAAEEFSLVFFISTHQQAELKVRSHSDPSVRYKISLAEQTCTCEDFDRRKASPKNHFSRWCKHLISALGKDGAFQKADEWQQALVAEGYGGPALAYTIKLNGAGPVLLTIYRGRDWLNIYARKQKRGERIANASGPITKYGWNVHQKRWSYGNGPPGSGELKKLLKVIESVK
jgi:hypothetical protein